MVLVSRNIRSKNKTNIDKLSEKAPTAKKNACRSQVCLQIETNIAIGANAKKVFP